MGFDPMSLIMMFGPLALQAMQGGNKGQRSSSFGKNQLQGIDDIYNAIKGQGGIPDITQNQNFQQGQQWLNDLYNDPKFFEKFEAPLQRQFQEQTVPELANRFASMGSGGSTGSTAFRNQLAREGSNLSTNIAALRGGMQQQGVNQSMQYAQQPFENIMRMYQQFLGQPTQNQYQPPSSGFWGDVAGPLFSAGLERFMTPGTNNNALAGGTAQPGFAGQSASTR